MGILTKKSIAYHEQLLSGNNEIKDLEIDVSSFKSIEIIFNFDVADQPPSYAYSSEIIEYETLPVKAKASSEIITEKVTYGKILGIADPTRPDHVFVGWFDLCGNEYDLNSIWTETAENLTLIARYQYNDYAIYVNEINQTYHRYENEIRELSFLSQSQIDKYLSQIDEAYSQSLKVFNKDHDKEDGFICKQTCIDSMSRIYYHALEEDLQIAKEFYCTELEAIAEGYYQLLGWLDADTLSQLRAALDQQLVTSQASINLATTLISVTTAYETGYTLLGVIYDSFI